MMIMTAANYLDDETILNHLPFLLPDEVKDILKRTASESVQRMTGGTQPQEQEQPQEE